MGIHGNPGSSKLRTLCTSRNKASPLRVSTSLPWPTRVHSMPQEMREMAQWHSGWIMMDYDGWWWMKLIHMASSYLSLKFIKLHNPPTIKLVVVWADFSSPNNYSPCHNWKITWLSVIKYLTAQKQPKAPYLSVSCLASVPFSASAPWPEDPKVWNSESANPLSASLWVRVTTLAPRTVRIVSANLPESSPRARHIDVIGCHIGVSHC